MQASHDAGLFGFRPSTANEVYPSELYPITDKQHQRVNDYYQETAFDYAAWWTGNEELAMHFGYWDAAVKTHSAALLRMNEVLAEKANIQTSDHVLDAGCGDGGSSLWLARTIGCRVAGITVVPFQATKAKKHASQRAVDHLTSFGVQDYTATTFPSASFDVVWAVESVVHAQNKQRFLQEAYRLLKPGGRLIMAEYTLRNESDLTPAEQQMMQPWLDGWAMPNLLSAKTYQALMQEVGFQQSTAEDITPNVLPSLKGLGAMSLFALALATALHKGASVIGRPHWFSQTRYGNVVGSIYQYYTLKQSLWRYSLLLGQK